MFYDIEHFQNLGLLICALGVYICISRRDGISEEPGVFNGDPFCCDPPVNTELGRISEIKEYEFEEACEGARVGLMYVNQFGLNEMFYFEGSIEAKTTANRVTYERNILNVPNRPANPPDRATAVLSADGSEGWTIEADFAREEDIRMLWEVLHSPSVRLLVREPVITECGTNCVEGCAPEVVETLVPVTITTDDLSLTKFDGEMLAVKLELTKARTRNAVNVF